MQLFKYSLALVCFYAATTTAQVFNCLDFDSGPVVPFTYAETTTDDFAFRMTLPQTEVSADEWENCCGAWGPCPMSYPQVVTSSIGIAKTTWSRERIVSAAQLFIDLPYAHHHIPAMGGLDCSNFTSWVYNFALGIRFTSNVEAQAEQAGRRLLEGESLAPGDLVFLWSEERDRISHVAIYMSEEEVIDSTAGGVQIRTFRGRYQERFAWARRILE